MKVKQLSVFLENKTGRINEVTRILGDNGINMTAFSIADSADFGILRLVVSNVDKAVDVLKKAGLAVTMTDVVCLNCPNTPGALSKILDILAAQDVFIEYMYAFSQGDKASVVIRPNDIDKCVGVLQDNRLELIASDQFYEI